MISVIVYTRNDQETIEWCLQSLIDQISKTGYEVIVIDDCSSDQTPNIVQRLFPQFRLIRQHHVRGWVKSLQHHLPSFQGDILAFLGAHCRARSGWIYSIEEEMAKGYKVISGIGYIGKRRLLDRYVAFAIPSYWEAQEEADFIWDDNFAIIPSILEGALPRTDILLPEGAGAVMLSRRLKDMGFNIYSRSSLKIDHIGNSLTRIVGLWYNMAAKNAVAMRRADPSLSGARFLSLWPLAATLIASGRLIQSSIAMVRTRRMFHISIPELGFHLLMQVFITPVYFLGLCRNLLLPSGRSN
ncbi:MAG: glycosyltransferase family A protein [Thermodesulfobacteriota bacterium]